MRAQTIPERAGFRVVPGVFGVPLGFSGVVLGFIFSVSALCFQYIGGFIDRESFFSGKVGPFLEEQRSGDVIRHRVRPFLVQAKHTGECAEAALAGKLLKGNIKCSEKPCHRLAELRTIGEFLAINLRRCEVAGL